MKLQYLYEDTVGSLLRRFIDMVRGNPGFGRGVDPKNWGEVEEIIEAHGMPKINFESEWEEAEKLEDQESKKALSIYKKLADKHPLSGLRSKSYYKRYREDNRLYVVIDLDNLKHLNTTLGHRGADTVIRTFGELLEQYLETEVNNLFGKISKAFHRSGDEFNVVINISDVSIPDLSRFVIKQTKKLLNKFSKIEFRGEMGKSRASATASIGFNEEEMDYKTDEMKLKRRSVALRGDMPHLYIDDKVKDLL